MIWSMARSKALRRHLTQRAQARRKRLSRESWRLCSAKVTPSGEKKNCNLCIHDFNVERRDWEAHQAKLLSSWVLAQD